MSARHDPWDRRPNETTKAYEAFTTYRDMDADRSLAKAGRALGKSKPLMEDWSSKHSWVIRAAAWDAEQDRLDRVEQAKARKDMADRHARIAGAMQGKLVNRLQSLNVDELSPRDLAYWLEVTAKVERQARGEPERVEVSGPNGGPIQTVQLTDEERRARMEELRRELEARLSGAQEVPA